MVVIVISGGRPVGTFPQDAPYPPLEQPFGGFPTISYDIPVMSVLLFLFSIAFIVHLALMFVNILRRGGFMVSTLITLFCAIRVVSLGLRISSTLDGFNGYLYVSQLAFLALGVFTLILANLAMSHHIFRAHHGSFLVLAVYLLIYFCMFLSLALLLTGIIQPTFTLDYYRRFVDRCLRIYGWTFMAVVAILPLPLVAISACLPRRRSQAGSLYCKFWILVLATLLVSLETWYIAGTEWVDPTSRFLPVPSYLSRAWYYIIIYTVELIVVFIYMFGGGRAGRGRRANNTNAAAAAGYAGPGPAGAAPPAGGWLSGTTAAAVPPAGRRKKSRFGGLGKLALGAGAGGAAGLLFSRRRRRNQEKLEKGVVEEDDLHRPPTPVGGPMLVDPLPPRLPPLAVNDGGPLMTTQPDANGVKYRNGQHALPPDPAEAEYPPTKEARAFDTETIPEESETEDSLYGVDSAVGTESKRHSTVSAPDPVKP